MTYVLFPHDDGRLWVATVLHQYRDRRTGAWQVVARYSTGVGETYIRCEPADRCRPVDDPPPGWTDPAHDGRVSPERTVTPSGAGPRAENTWLW